LPEGKIAAKSLTAVLAQPKVERLSSVNRFSVEGSITGPTSFRYGDEASLTARRRGP
jgi:hypothetical protein